MTDTQILTPFECSGVLTEVRVTASLVGAQEVFNSHEALRAKLDEATKEAGEALADRDAAQMALEDLRAKLAAVERERDEWKRAAGAHGVYGTSGARELLDQSLNRAEQAEAAITAEREAHERTKAYLDDILARVLKSLTSSPAPVHVREIRRPA